MRKLKPREVESLARGHTAGRTKAGQLSYLLRQPAEPLALRLPSEHLTRLCSVQREKLRQDELRKVARETRNCSVVRKSESERGWAESSFSGRSSEHLRGRPAWQALQETVQRLKRC